MGNLKHIFKGKFKYDIKDDIEDNLKDNNNNNYKPSLKFWSNNLNRKNHELNYPTTAAYFGVMVTLLPFSSQFIK